MILLPFGCFGAVLTFGLFVRVPAFVGATLFGEQSVGPIAGAAICFVAWVLFGYTNYKADKVARR